MSLNVSFYRAATRYTLCGIALLLCAATVLHAQRTFASDRQKSGTSSQREQQCQLVASVALPHDFRLWRQLPALAELRVFNPRTTAGEAEISIRITEARKRVEARSRGFAPPVLVVASGWNTYTAADLFSNTELEWFDGDRRLPTTSDTLPEGLYILHISLRPRTPLDSIAPVETQTAFTAIALDRPALRKPEYTWNLDSSHIESIRFQWRYPAEVVFPGFQWTVRIAEAPGTAPTDNIERLPTVMERVVADSTQFLLSIPLSHLQPGRRYAWSVLPTARTGTFAAWPRPAVFTIPTSATPKH